MKRRHAVDASSLEHDRVRGCLLGGALGDALGASVEFDTIDAIRARHGDAGVTEPRSPLCFTDDTQMTLFTCEGLIRGHVRAREHGLGLPIEVIHHAYLRWLHTQGVPWPRAGARYADAAAAEAPDGWLVAVGMMHRRRAPGSTCLGALESGMFGTTEQRINASKGCGGVMRAAPAGFFFTGEDAFDAGCDVAAITHGHPSGYLSAGVLAAIVSELARGGSVAPATEAALRRLHDLPEAEEVASAMRRARDVASHGLPPPETIERELGGGWVGEEALAIALCCALADGTPVAKLRAAVNHSGDSDSTGSICGNLVGAEHGVSAFPASWLAVLEGADVVTTVADDVYREIVEQPDAGGVNSDWWTRYPGW